MLRVPSNCYLQIKAMENVRLLIDVKKFYWTRCDSDKIFLKGSPTHFRRNDLHPPK